MQVRGSHVVIAIFLLAAGMSGYAWYSHFTRGQKIREYLSKESTLLVRHSDRVELATLVGNELGEWKDISTAPGLIHARHALVEDTGYVWDAETKNFAPTVAAKFADGEKSVVLLLDLETGSLSAENKRDQPLRMTEKIKEGWRTFSARHLAPTKEKPTEPSPAGK